MRSKLILLACCAMTAVNLFGGSLAESAIRSKAPKTFKAHTNGPVAFPSKGEIAEAEEFGKKSKESSVVDVVYTYARPAAFAKNDARVYVVTPLCLVAQDARMAARDFVAPSASVQSYAATCGVVRLFLRNFKMMPGGMVGNLAEDHVPILLRDGVRVPALTSIPAVEGKNPYYPIMRSAFGGNQSDATQLALSIVQKYASDNGGKPSPSGASVDVTSDPTFFSSEELKKPGKYEIVFRTRKVDVSSSVPEVEIRFELDLKKFR